MLLTPTLLALQLRRIVRENYPSLAACARALGYTPHHFTEYTRLKATRAKTVMPLVKILDRLGYEVHFTIVKKGESNEEGNR